MAVKINYESLFKTSLKFMSKDTLQLIQVDILKRAGELADLTMTTVPEMKELDNLVAQARLLGMFIRAQDCKFCDINNFKFCLDCFDEGFTKG